MSRYTIREIYTPDDPELDRSRWEHELESDSDDITELIVQAYVVCHKRPISQETMQNILAAVNESLRDYSSDELAELKRDLLEHGSFEFTIFHASAETLLKVGRI